MGSKIAAVFLAFSLGFAPALAFAGEAEYQGGDRYFLQSTSGIWKKTLGVRHEFENGFTAELSPAQLGIARIAGLHPLEVGKLSILAEGEPVAATPRPEPATRIPWGVGLVTDYHLEPSAGTSVSVAVLDTGVDVTHPDLARRIAGCADFTQELPFVDASCADDNGHGTLVAGIIAADGGADNLGVFGIAPAASVFASKVCIQSGSCWADDVAVALRSAADAGINIVNLSLGADTEDESGLVGDAVAYAATKGTLVVAAAGNDGPYEASVDWPAAGAAAVSVSALDAQLAVPEWSSRGANATSDPVSRDDGDVEFAAPGDNIESTFTGGGYGILSGTSMAAPHVAGLAAVLWLKDGALPAEDTRALLHQRAVDIMPAGDDSASGWGVPTR